MEKVKNPLTGGYIHVGSRLWRDLVKKGIVVSDMKQTDRFYLYNPRNLVVDSNLKKLSIHITNDTTIHLLERVLDTTDLKTTKTRTRKNLLDGMFWYDMPEYVDDEEQFFPVLTVWFVSNIDKQTFLTEIGVKPTKLSFIYFPNRPVDTLKTSHHYDTSSEIINPIYPVYIISKGRYNDSVKFYKTYRTLERMGVPYKMVVEKSEYKQYCKIVSPDVLLILPEHYKTHSEHGGSIPARNFVWQHAVDSGAQKHWIIDDNISGFWCKNKGRHWEINSGVVFRILELYVSQFENVKQSGFNYKHFIVARKPSKPVTFNTRIYSCILLDHRLDDILEERWRGTYNEDTDLSLRILKAGAATCLFNAFTCDKQGTLTGRGGNTDSIYNKGDSKSLKNKAESLADQHPDVAKIVKKYKRGIHHQVNYKPFKENELRFIGNGDKTSNEYNMRFVI